MLLEGSNVIEAANSTGKNMGDADRSKLDEGRYANYFEIAHNAFDFFLDLGQLGRTESEPRIYLRVIISPAVALGLSQKLNESLNQYRASFGPIQHEGDI